jgi:hypothetical protein
LFWYDLIEQSSRKIGCIAAIVLLLTASFSTMPQTAFGASSTGVIVPLYTYPGSTWDAVISAKNTHPAVPIVVIVNCCNGPGSSKDSTWATWIQKMQSAGIIVIGYVDTLYGSISSTTVKSEIDAWRSWYNVDGIFFDEMSNWAGGEAYYSSLNSYVKSKGMTFTVGNPGTDTLTSYIGTVDNMLIYESAGLPSISSLAGWHTNYNKANFGIIPFGVGSLDTSYEASASNYVGYMYITNDNLPNPWDSLPPYFGNLVAALDTGQGDTTVPQVSITSPATGSTVSSTITVSVSASDNVAISKVEMYVDGTLKNTKTSTPYSFSLDTTTLSNGLRTIMAKAYDTSNNVGTSSVTVTVSNPVPPVSTSTGVAVPLYTYPTDSTWATIRQVKLAHPSVRIVAIVDPTDSGAGSSQDSNYVNGINSLKAVGITVVGYIDTLYTSRSTSAVKTEIDNWKSWYNVDGVFFDEMSNWAGGESYYSNLNAYAKSKSMTFTIGNPGTYTIPSYIGTVDMMFTYESAGLPSISSLQGWYLNYDKKNFGIIPYAVGSLDTSYVASASNYVGYVYITNDNVPNPWDTLPPYFGNLVAALDTGSIIPDNPPTISVTRSPFHPNSTQTVTFSASATDDKGLSSIKIFIDGSSIGSCSVAGTSASCSKTSGPYGTGTSHSFYATATDTKPQTSQSTTGTFSVVDIAPPSPPQLNPIANWKFEDNALDNSGNGNNGILINGPTFVAGKIGKALSFDGVDDHVVVSDTNILTPGTQATFVAWVFPRAINENYDSIISKWDGTDEDEYLVGLQTSGAISFAWHTSGCMSSCGAQYGTGAYNDVVSAIKVRLNAWNFIAVVRDGTTLIFYNGTHTQTVNNAFDSNPFRNGVVSLKIGAENSASNNRHINGIIDEVAIWNRALSAAEIQSLFASNPVPNPPTALTATAVSSSQINLAWTAPSGTVTGYKIERESPVGSGFTTIVANTGTISTTYSNTGLTASTVYNYRVSAINSAGTGPASNTASATTLTADNPPTISVTQSPLVPNSTQAVIFTGTATDDKGLNSIQIFVDGSSIGSCSVTGTSASCSKTAGPYTAGTSHSFYATATDTKPQTSQSTTGTFIIAAIAPTPPGPPTGLVATAVSASQINLAWTAPSGTVTGYKIERESPVGHGFSTIVANSGTTAVTYSNTGLAAGTQYGYRVSAINSAGTSNPSSEANATTWSSPPKQVLLTVKSTDLAGNLITGLWTTIKSGGSTVRTGYTTLTYTANSGVAYTVCVSNYGRYTFNHWEDGSTKACRNITPTQDTTLTAYYNVKVYLTIRSVNLSGNLITGLWAEIYQNGALVSTGYTTATYGATSGTQYTVCMANYQNYVFDHWEDGTTNACRNITPTQDTTLTAYYKT